MTLYNKQKPGITWKTVIRRVASAERASGVTLIELLIAVAIVGILIAAAVPGYSRYMTTTRRADGMSELSRVIQLQERYFLNNMSYSADLAELGLSSEKSGSLSKEGYYKITASACSGSTITRCVSLTATPVGNHEDDGKLTLTSRGEKTWSGHKSGESGWP